MPPEVSAPNLKDVGMMVVPGLLALHPTQAKQEEWLAGTSCTTAGTIDKIQERDKIPNSSWQDYSVLDGGAVGRVTQDRLSCHFL